MNRSGVVHLIAQDDKEALQLCRRLLSFMPSNNLEDPPRMPFNSRIKSDSDMNSIVPVDPKSCVRRARYRHAGCRLQRLP